MTRIVRGSVHDRLRLLIRRRTCSTGLRGTVSLQNFKNKLTVGREENFKLVFLSF